ncbi:MAG TPA: DUF4870 domain-containing protein [Pseudogracilibacillus sp.]|nr:DUF4870 domain-containing protein [Pseudogracilibacillus sp.]
MNEQNQEIVQTQTYDSGHVNEQTSGMSSNVAGFLSYLFGFITGIIFLIVKREDKFVRYHAWQSIIVFGTLFVVDIVFFIADVVFISIPIIGWIFGVFSILISVGLALLNLIVWIYLMVQAYKGKMPSLPIAGPMARGLAK